jgi:hypothetical protein
VAALSVCNQLQHSLAAETEALVEIHEEAGHSGLFQANGAEAINDDARTYGELHPTTRSRVAHEIGTQRCQGAPALPALHLDHRRLTTHADAMTTPAHNILHTMPTSNRR